MEVFDCIRTRRSIRKYKDKPVEWDKVVTILEAGRLAPSAGNLQNIKFIVIKDQETRKKVAETALNQKWMEKAPVHIVVCSEPEKSKRFYGIRGERLYTIQDCAAAIENMLLTAHSLGLGACWVGAYEEDALRRVINPPEQAVTHAIITLGYADEEPVMPAKNRIEHFVFLDKWGQRKKVPLSSAGWWSVRVKKVVDDTKKSIKKKLTTK